jgi:hypothetical protein
MTIYGIVNDQDESGDEVVVSSRPRGSTGEADLMLATLGQ